MAPNTSPRIPAALAILTTCTGCYTTWDVPVKDVVKVDGYRAPNQKVLAHVDGDDVVVDPDTELRFQAGTPGPELRAKFDAIDVHDGPDGFWISGVLHGDGQPLRVDLRKVTHLSAQRYSSTKTAVAVVVPILAVGLAVGIALGVAVASIPKD